MTNDEEKNFKKKALKLITTDKDLKQKVFELLDKSLATLQDEVDLLKFKLLHNELSDEELQAIYD